jgi:hypothetical protein
LRIVIPPARSAILRSPALSLRISRPRGANGAAGAGAGRTDPAAAAGPWREAPGWRRALQLALAALWLLDAVLQYQSFMFTQGFPRMLAATAAGNPGPVAGPVIWSAHLIGTHPGPATAAFGTVQLLLALGIAWRPTVRAASGDPGWLRSLDNAASGLAGQHAAVAGLVTAVLLAVVAAGVYLPVPAARAALCLAVLASVAMWAGGQDLGGLFTRATTDPDTAPLLILLAAAY